MNQLKEKQLFGKDKSFFEDKSSSYPMNSANINSLARNQDIEDQYYLIELSVELFNQICFLMNELQQNILVIIRWGINLLEWIFYLKQLINCKVKQSLDHFLKLLICYHGLTDFYYSISRPTRRFMRVLLLTGCGRLCKLSRRSPRWKERRNNSKSSATNSRSRWTLLRTRSRKSRWMTVSKERTRRSSTQNWWTFWRRLTNVSRKS